MKKNTYLCKKELLMLDMFYALLNTNYSEAFFFVLFYCNIFLEYFLFFPY